MRLQHSKDDLERQARRCGRKAKVAIETFRNRQALNPAAQHPAPVVAQPATLIDGASTEDDYDELRRQRDDLDEAFKSLRIQMDIATQRIAELEGNLEPRNERGRHASPAAGTSNLSQLRARHESRPADAVQYPNLRAHGEAEDSGHIAQDSHLPVGESEDRLEVAHDEVSTVANRGASRHSGGSLGPRISQANDQRALVKASRGRPSRRPKQSRSRPAPEVPKRSKTQRQIGATCGSGGVGDA